MIVVLAEGCSGAEREAIVRALAADGREVHESAWAGERLLGVVGGGDAALVARLRALRGAREVRPDAPPWPLVSRGERAERTRVDAGGVVFGGPEVVIVAGPCAVESEAQLLSAAEAVAAAGARLLRGGAFKPRTSPYSFRGLGEEGLSLLAMARERTGLRVVTEVLAPEDVPLVARYADVLQVGARNMHNSRLLAALGAQPRPVLLKRGMAATLEELLLAAEHVVAAGNAQVLLCERGIRTFERATRSTLDLSAVPALHELTHLPVLVDPSHAAGRRELVPALARAAVAAGADALLVEVHPDPVQALSDGRESLTPPAFAALMDELRRVAAAVGRTVAGARPGQERAS